MTGQMTFDSHVPFLVETIVRLVNAVTPGAEGGRDHPAPTGETLRLAVAGAVGGADDDEAGLTGSDAEHLAELAVRARAVVEALVADDDEAAARQVNEMLADTGARPQLDRAAAGGWTLHFHGPDTSVALGWGAGIAAGLAMALGSELGGRLGVCEATGCDRVHVDLSRNGGRRFCGTRCQSRIKAAAHRERSRR